MKKITLLKLLPAAAICSSGLQADILNVFEDVTSLDTGAVPWGLTTTNSTNSDTEVVNDFTSPASALTGDALRQWDADGAGRTTLRFLSDTAFTSGVQVSFDAYIDPTSSGSNFMRMGNNAASMAGIKPAGFSLAIDSTGDINATVADTVNGGRVDQVFAGAATVGTPFNVSVVFNAAEAGDLTFSYGAGDLTLAPQTWALFVDNSLLATDLVGLNATSTADGTYSYDPAAGAQDVWWFTGGASSQSGMEFQYDNIVVNTGADISVVPEPSTIALVFGSLGLGLVLLRRIRRR